jgi:hypothetical protein
MYAARSRNGFTPKLRAELLRRFKPLETGARPFANLPEKKAGRWGVGLTAAKMEECRWLRPQPSLSLSSWSGLRTRTFGTAVWWGCGRTRRRRM